MAIDTAALFRFAAVSAGAALACLAVAAVALGLFFGGAGERFGPVNDIFTALALAFLALPVAAVWVAVRDETGAWFGIVSVLALAGIAVAATGQVALVLGRITLQTSFVTGGIGFVPVLAWIAAVSYVSFTSETLPDAIGWTGLTSIVLVGLTTVVALRTRGRILWVVTTALAGGLAAFLAALAVGLLGRA